MFSTMSGSTAGTGRRSDPATTSSRERNKSMKNSQAGRSGGWDTSDNGFFSSFNPCADPGSASFAQEEGRDDDCDGNSISWTANGSQQNRQQRDGPRAREIPGRVEVVDTSDPQDLGGSGERAQRRTERPLRQSGNTDDHRSRDNAATTATASSLVSKQRRKADLDNDQSRAAVGSDDRSRTAAESPSFSKQQRRMDLDERRKATAESSIASKQQQQQRQRDLVVERTAIAVPASQPEQQDPDEENLEQRMAVEVSSRRRDLQKLERRRHDAAVYLDSRKTEIKNLEMKLQEDLERIERNKKETEEKERLMKEMAEQKLQKKRDLAKERRLQKKDEEEARRLADQIMARVLQRRTEESKEEDASLRKLKTKTEEMKLELVRKRSTLEDLRQSTSKEFLQEEERIQRQGDNEADRLADAVLKSVVSKTELQAKKKGVSKKQQEADIEAAVQEKLRQELAKLKAAHEREKKLEMAKVQERLQRKEGEKERIKRRVQELDMELGSAQRRLQKDANLKRHPEERRQWKKEIREIELDIDAAVDKLETKRKEIAEIKRKISEAKQEKSEEAKMLELAELKRRQEVEEATNEARRLADDVLARALRQREMEKKKEAAGVENTKKEDAERSLALMMHQQKTEEELLGQKQEAEKKEKKRKEQEARERKKLENDQQEARALADQVMANVLMKKKLQDKQEDLNVGAKEQERMARMEWEKKTEEELLRQKQEAERKEKKRKEQEARERKKRENDQKEARALADQVMANVLMKKKLQDKQEDLNAGAKEQERMARMEWEKKEKAKREKEAFLNRRTKTETHMRREEEKAARPQKEREEAEQMDAQGDEVASQMAKEVIEAALQKNRGTSEIDMKAMQMELEDRLLIEHTKKMQAIMEENEAKLNALKAAHKLEVEHMAAKMVPKVAAKKKETAVDSTSSPERDQCSLVSKDANVEAEPSPKQVQRSPVDEVVEPSPKQVQRSPVDEVVDANANDSPEQDQDSSASEVADVDVMEEAFGKKALEIQSRMRKKHTEMVQRLILAEKEEEVKKYDVIMSDDPEEAEMGVEIHATTRVWVAADVVDENSVMSAERSRTYEPVLTKKLDLSPDIANAIDAQTAEFDKMVQGMTMRLQEKRKATLELVVKENKLKMEQIKATKLAQEKTASQTKKKRGLFSLSRRAFARSRKRVEEGGEGSSVKRSSGVSIAQGNGGARANVAATGSSRLPSKSSSKTLTEKMETGKASARQKSSIGKGGLDPGAEQLKSKPASRDVSVKRNLPPNSAPGNVSLKSQKSLLRKKRVSSKQDGHRHTMLSIKHNNSKDASENEKEVGAAVDNFHDILKDNELEGRKRTPEEIADELMKSVLARKALTGNL